MRLQRQCAICAFTVSLEQEQAGQPYSCKRSCMPCTGSPDLLVMQERYLGLVPKLMELIVSNETALSAAVYTELCDVEGEINGFLTYDRQVVKVCPPAHSLDVAEWGQVEASSDQSSKFGNRRCNILGTSTCTNSGGHPPPACSVAGSSCCVGCSERSILLPHSSHLPDLSCP